MDGESGRTWLLTEDDQLAEELARHLDEGDGCGLDRCSASQWESRRPDLASAECVIVDMRDPRVWDCLPWREQWSGRSSALVGIVDKGIPLARAGEADHLLFATLAWPVPRDLLREAVALAGRSKRHRPGDVEHRLLESDTSRFLTYTPALFPVIDQILVAARHDFDILLVGETGSGKTTLARMVHELSPRKQNRFLTVSCGALPNELMGSELFGHEKGAFTGADRSKVGKFELANRGTILLDEIDVLDMDQQAKLLRVIETGEFEPVGSNETHLVDIRMVAASNHDLESLVAAGRFRADLYFRLTQLSFELPPLRKRPRDIVPLAVGVIEECLRDDGLEVRLVHPEVLELLKDYPWPGNIRELRNEVRRAVLFSRNGVMTPDCFSPGVRKKAQQSRDQRRGCPSKSQLSSEVSLTEVEAIEQMLRAQNFNRSATARALGISRVTLYNKIRKYRIQLDEPSDRTGD